MLCYTYGIWRFIYTHTYIYIYIRTQAHTHAHKHEHIYSCDESSIDNIYVSLWYIYALKLSFYNIAAHYLVNSELNIFI